MSETTDAGVGDGAHGPIGSEEAARRHYRIWPYDGSEAKPCGCSTCRVGQLNNDYDEPAVAISVPRQNGISEYLSGLMREAGR